MPPRLLHVSQPIDAGVPNVVATLVTAQLAAGAEVHVACPPGDGLAARAQALGATHHAWRARREPGLAVLSETRRLRSVIDSVDPDLVILHSAKAGLAGRLAVRGRRPTVYVPHAWSFEAVRGLTARLAGAWEVLAGRWTHSVVCVSADEERRGRERGIRCRTDVVPNGVDVVALTPRAAGPARTRLGLPDRPTVVCVGRLAEQKGQDLLLAAWPQVVAAVPRAQLVLVGEGPLRAELTSAAPADVVLTGRREDAHEYLAAADVVALPSRWESTPLVSLEAMSLGRPVVAFAVDGVRSAFGDTGAVVEPGDVDRFADALVRWLRDPGAAAEAGRRARERALEVADARRAVRQWDEVLATVLAGSSRRDAPSSTTLEEARHG